MSEEQKIVLSNILALVIILTPMLIGAFLAWKFGPTWRRRAAVRRMETAILTGQMDADHTQEAVENLRNKGYIE